MIKRKPAAKKPQEKTKEQAFEEAVTRYLANKEASDALAETIEADRKMILAYVESSVPEEIGSTSRVIDTGDIRTTVVYPKDSVSVASNAIEVILKHVEAKEAIKYCSIATQQVERMILDGVLPESDAKFLFLKKHNAARLSVRRIKRGLIDEPG